MSLLPRPICYQRSNNFFAKMHFPKYSGYSINNRACSQAFHCDFACFAMEFNVLRYFIRIYCIFCTFRCILTFCCPLLNFQSPPLFFQYIFSSVLCYFVVRVLYFHTFSASAIIAEYFLYIFFYIFFSLIYI